MPFSRNLFQKQNKLLIKIVCYHIILLIFSFKVLKSKQKIQTSRKVKVNVVEKQTLVFVTQ